MSHLKLWFLLLSWKGSPISSVLKAIGPPETRRHPDTLKKKAMRKA
jgi:hypothetical protein